MNTVIRIGNRLDRHDVGELMIGGIDAYAVAYANCTTKTDHAATVAFREVVGKITAAKLAKADKFAFFGCDASGKADSGVNYVRAIALAEMDKGGDFYSRKVGSVTVRGSLALLKSRCAATKTTVTVLDSAKAKTLAAKLRADKGLAQVWQSVGVNRNGKSRALACDDLAVAGLIDDVRAK